MGQTEAAKRFNAFDGYVYVEGSQSNNSGGTPQFSFDVGMPIYLTSTLASLLNENAVRNVNAIQKSGAWWKSLTGKLAGKAAKDLASETFTKTLTETIGKRLFLVSVAYSVYSVANDSSWENIVLNAADVAIGAAGVWIPGMQIPAF